MGICRSMRANEVFNALADPTRRAIVEALARSGSCTATELASDMPITRQAVAKHLATLHRADLVLPERRGRESRYRLVTSPLNHAIDWLEDVCNRVSDEQEAA
jgi:DNA-binding transcriptional ArsR family regulator